MDAKLKSFQQMMVSAYRFLIPEYQRPFCWSAEEVEQLWNDVFGALADFRATPPQPGAEEYFLGPVVVANELDAAGRIRAHVVDGQQRLTTLHALLWCAHQRLTADHSQRSTETQKELEHFLLTPNLETTLAVAGEDQADFHALRHGAHLNDQRELGRAGRLIRERLSGLNLDETLALVKYIQNRLKFVHVETADFGEAWNLFIGLNGKGRPLTPADLIKAFACGKSDDGKAMADMWRDKVQSLDNAATSAILEVIRAATGDVASDARLFKKFQTAWRNQVSASLLVEGCELYNLLWLAPLEEMTSLQNGTPRSLRGLRSLGRQDHSSAMVAFRARFDKDSVFRPDVIKALESFQLWMAVRGLRGRERRFTELAYRVFSQSCSETEAVRALSKLLRELAPPADQVRGGIKELRYPGRIMKFILLQYEEGQRGDVQVSNIDFEHMMPKTSTEYWLAAAGTSDLLEYDRIVDNIGNLAPLDHGSNLDVGQDDWKKKCEAYRSNVPSWTLRGIAHEHPASWTPVDIKKRASEIADWAIDERWNLTRDLDALDARI